MKFFERLAECRAVAEVAARNDNVIGRLPAELLQHFEHRRLLTFKPKRVDGVQEIQAVSCLVQQPLQCDIEIAGHMHDLRAEIHRLRQLVGRDVTRGHVNPGVQSRARRIGCERAGGVTGGSTADNLRADVHRFRHSNGHSQILEARGRIPAKMFEPEIAQARPPRGLSTFDQRAVPFSHGHDFGIAVRQKFAEAPYAAEIARIVRASAFEPGALQFSRRRRRRVDHHFEQLGTDRTGQGPVM